MREVKVKGRVCSSTLFHSRCRDVYIIHYTYLHQRKMLKQVKEHNSLATQPPDFVIVSLDAHGHVSKDGNVSGQ
jgi:hypothetical protein